MKDLPNRLVVVLLLIVVISTIITTIAFFQIEKKAFLARTLSATPSDTGRVSITIAGEEQLAVADVVSSGSGKIGIQIAEKTEE